VPKRRDFFRNDGNNPHILGSERKVDRKTEDYSEWDKSNLNELSHKRSDVDSGPNALHHTLGFGAGQAAPGPEVGSAIQAIRTNPELVVITSTQLGFVLPTGLRRVKFICVGGGGAGGGAAATGATSNAEGGGGGGGGLAIAWLEIDEIPASFPVTVGSGGNGASAGNNDGGGGGITSVIISGSTICRATGGAGGSGSGAGTGAASSGGGNGGLGTHGDILMSGSDGGNGRRINGINAMANHGGGSPYSGIAASALTNSNGRVGRPYGGGSSGARNGNDQAARPSPSGANGVVFLEYYF
jgi:hypothetical protein